MAGVHSAGFAQQTLRHPQHHTRHSFMMKSTLLIAASLLLSLSPAPAQDPKAANPAMNTIGALGAQGVFSTYMAIAELADLYGAKAYDKQKALQLAGGYAGLTEAAKDSLSDLVDSGKLSSDDEAAVNQMIVINDLLGKTAQGIITYIKEPSDENEAAYDKNRQKSWKAISKFLDIEE
jgi:ABC-type phosphate transport system substrate-binding protein